MKTSQKNLLLTLIVLLLTSGLVWGGEAKDKVKPVDGFTILDSRGRKVGSVLGFWPIAQDHAWGGPATVGLLIEGELVVLYVNPDGFTGLFGGFTRNLGVTFESSNCNGPAFTSPLVIDKALAPPHVLVGTRLYSFDGSPKNTVIASHEHFNGMTYICETFSQPESPQMQPLRFLIDLADHFQPPFTLR